MHALSYAANNLSRSSSNRHRQNEAQSTDASPASICRRSNSSSSCLASSVALSILRSTSSRLRRTIAKHLLFSVNHLLLSAASCLHDAFFSCSVNLFFCAWSCHLPRGSSMALVPTDVAVWWRWRSAECKVSFASCMLQQDQQCCLHSASTAITKLLRARSNRQKLCRSEQAADSKHAQTGARRRARLQL